MIADALKALGQMGDPRFRRVLVLGVGLSLALLVAFSAVLIWLAQWLVGPSVTIPWASPRTMKASTSIVKSSRRPNRSVRKPASGAPTKMPISEEAPIRPASTGVRPSAFVMTGSATLMTPRSKPSSPSPQAAAKFKRRTSPVLGRSADGGAELMGGPSRPRAAGRSRETMLDPAGSPRG